ncbi:MAG: hypothetical protein NTW16_08905 [Bacteroidetes bacterium]|nr:hypothetical protein [Bacteroidota bacterium]
MKKVINLLVILKGMMNNICDGSLDKYGLVILLFQKCNRPVKGRYLVTS